MNEGFMMYRRILTILLIIVVCGGCEDEPPATVWNDTPSRIPVVRLVHDGVVDDAYAFHLQVDAVLEHDIIVYMQIANDRSGAEDNRFLMMRAGDFKSELMSIRDPHITPEQIKRRNDSYGEKTGGVQEERQSQGYILRLPQTCEAKRA